MSGLPPNFNPYNIPPNPTYNFNIDHLNAINHLRPFSINNTLLPTQVPAAPHQASGPQPPQQAQQQDQQQNPDHEDNAKGNKRLWTDDMKERYKRLRTIHTGYGSNIRIARELGLTTGQVCTYISYC